MPDEDFKVYHKILWNFGDAKAYEPWVKKMRPQDRLVIRGGRGSLPSSSQLEWEYGVSGIWIGRLPRIPQSGTPPPDHSRNGDARHFNQFGEFSEVTARRIFCARAKSFSVKPPASCVVSASVTLFQRMSMSG